MMHSCEFRGAATSHVVAADASSDDAVPQDIDQATATVSMKKFHVVVKGRTNRTHEELVVNLKSSGQTEVSSPEESDYLLVFCPIVSQVETDISKALKNIPGGKPIILVVMHHTLNPDQVVAPSREQMDDPNVHLTVDCLFYEGRFLQCNRNYIAWVDIQKSLRVIPLRVHTANDFVDLLWKKVFVTAIGPTDQAHQDMVAKLQSVGQTNVSWKKFFVFVMGRTDGAHEDIVAKLKSTGQSEVSSSEDSDYFLIFYSPMSEVEICISKFLEDFSGGKPIILVVIHHTSNPDQVVVPSIGQEDNLDVYLTVDCLFYEGKLLQCNSNHSAQADIQRSLEVSTSQVPILKAKEVLRKKFFVIVSGKTNGAHQELVSKLISSGQTFEVFSPEESDYRLVFCPIASRVGTDISEALENISGGKPIILVVMHHTFNRDQVVAPSRRQVENRNVHLTVDCLFYEGSFLQCKHNDRAWADIKKLLGVSTAQVPISKHKKVMRKKFFVIVSGKINGAHRGLVSKLKSSGQTEVFSAEKSDYLLVFCPIASRVGGDISEAVENIPGGKPIILVVMHRTFNRDQVVAPSRRQVDNRNVRLIVDCLFYEGSFLKCKHNDSAWLDIQKFLGVSTPQVPIVKDKKAKCDLLRKKFFVIVSGKTNGAHQELVSKLKSSGQTEVFSAEESDNRLVFCPISSRVGTDISEALENIPGVKPIILVVMHHTFNPDQVVAPSRRHVENPNVCLTVDCLFYEGKLLHCERNDSAWVDIQKTLGVSTALVRTFEDIKEKLTSFKKKK